MSISGILFSACSPKPANQNLILATTTSTQDSGLLDLLVPLFQEQTGYTVSTIAVGTGQALKMGEEGNADVLLVHAPSAEEEFMKAGFGKERALVMHNDFIIVGPPDDPADIKGKPVVDAFQAMSEGGSFVSRGDDSGTNKAELALWKSTGLDPKTEVPDWYLETGQGMGATLTIASEKEAYTLTDRATYLANQSNLDLFIQVEGDQPLLNIYHVIAVNPEKWPKVNHEGALAFIDFLTNPDTQKAIGEFGVKDFGEPLFYPDADKTDEQLGL